VSPEDLCSLLADDLDEAFPHLVVAFQDGLFSGTLRIVGNRSDAEDLTQETLVRAYRALRGYEPARIRELKLTGWLWTIALNLSRNRLRSRARRPRSVPLDDAMISARPDPPPLDQHWWNNQLGALPRRQREAVVLRHVIGLSYDEIATATGRPVGTLKSDVHRALTALRAQLTEQGVHS
jgi:RNA polymerase sigma factor (sigma-70 family)